MISSYVKNNWFLVLDVFRPRKDFMRQIPRSIGLRLWLASSPGSCAGLFIALAWLALGAVQAQDTTYVLGTTYLLIGPAAGSDSVVLAVAPQTGLWAATNDVPWLHLSAANQSGTGSTNVIFSYDDNPGATRSGTLTIAGQTLTVNQAGSTYIVAGAVTLLPIGLFFPNGVAVDGAGNVYFGDSGHNTIKKWSPAMNTVSTLVSSELLGFATELAVDEAGNLYIADALAGAIKELPYAFVDPTPKLESLAAGNDSLPAVLPITENLLPPFAPTSDQPWLTLTGITNGVVSFSFTANAGPARTAHIALLGQNISITQGVIGTPPALTGVQMLSNGVFQFAFTNTSGAAFTVISSTNLSLPLSEWTVAGTATNTAPTQFQFTSQPETNETQIFYGVRSP
jgi:hypothetical protein